MKNTTSSTRRLLVVSFPVLLAVSFILPNLSDAQILHSYRSIPTVTLPGLLRGHSAFPFANDPTVPADRSREDKCLGFGRWLGVASGSTMGLFHLYWSATDQTGSDEPYWKNLLTGIPSSLIGAYVGHRTTEWTTRQIMKGRPKPFRAALKGAFYGAIDGAIILSASMIPLFILGHYLGTINFNEDKSVLEVVGMSILGGVGFGGLTGAAIGCAYGPGLSLYMNF